MSINPVNKQIAPTSHNSEPPLFCKICCKMMQTAMKCSKCHIVPYCSRECQKKDWSEHKKVCHIPSELRLAPVVEQPCIIGEFSEEDLELIGCTKEQLKMVNLSFKNSGREPLVKATLPCLEFALLEAREKGVREQMLVPFLNNNASIKKQLEARLERWGYDVVQSGKAGDLILYFDENDLTHVGLYLGDGLVKSKLGNGVMYSSVHQVEALFGAMYGFKNSYYRKNPQTEGKYPLRLKGAQSKPIQSL